MSEPRRWNDPRGDAPSGVRDMLRYAERTRPMSPADLGRTAAQITKVAAAPTIAATSVAAWLSAKGAVAVATVGLAVGLTVAVARAPSRTHAGATGAPHASPSPSAPRAVSAPSVVAPPAVAPPALAAPADPREPAPSVPTARAAHASGARAAAAASTAAATPEVQDAVTREVNALGRARALVERRPAEAYALLRAHAAQFATGMLGEEREALTIDALRRLGRAREARARAEAFLARHPTSINAERVRGSLNALRAAP